MIRTFIKKDIPIEKILERGDMASGVEEIVAGIIADVRANGDEALYRMTEKFDKVKLDSLLVTQAEVDEAYNALDDFNFPQKITSFSVMGEVYSEVVQIVVRGDLKDTVNEELFDILYYTLSFANAKGIDLETWIPIKEAINNKRYPSGIEFNPEDESWFEE